MTEFKFSCPHCSQSLEASQDLLGATIQCPVCNHSIQLPAPDPTPQPPQERVVRTKPKSQVSSSQPSSSARPNEKSGIYRIIRVAVVIVFLLVVIICIIAMVNYIIAIVKPLAPSEITPGTPVEQVYKELGSPKEWINVNTGNGTLSKTTYHMGALPRMLSNEFWMWTYVDSSGDKVIIIIKNNIVDSVKVVDASKK